MHKKVTGQTFTEDINEIENTVVQRKYSIMEFIFQEQNGSKKAKIYKAEDFRSAYHIHRRVTMCQYDRQN